MDYKKIRALKRNEKTAILIFAIALLNILAFAFTLVRGEVANLSGGDRFYANGFTLVFAGYPSVIEGCGDILRFFAVIQLGLSALLLASLCVFSLIKRSVDFGKFGTFSVILSLLLSVFYMIFGIAAYSEASALMSPLYDECLTASFLPLVFSLLIAILYFAVRSKKQDSAELFSENR